MMKCYHCLGGMCKKFGKVCDHLVYDGKCEFANSTEDTTPTFAQMYGIYCSAAKCSDMMKDKTLVALRGIAQLAGLPFDGRGELTADEWELVYRRMRDMTFSRLHESAMELGISLDDGAAPTDEQWKLIYEHLMKKEGTDGSEEGYDPSTITYYFSRYRAAAGLSCKDIRKAYKKHGLKPPDCDFIPDVDYSGKKNTIETLTHAQIKIIKDKMVELSKSKRIMDYNRYMRLFFGLYFGCRPCDIHVLKWDSIKKDQLGGYYFEYIPSKTAHSTHNRPAGCPIHPALLSEILPLIGKHGSYVLLHRTSMARGNNTSGRFVRDFKYLERWVSAFMRNEVGIRGFGTTYMLRKECGKYNTEKHGPLYATKLLGNSPSVLFKHYVPIDKLTLK